MRHRFHGWSWLPAIVIVGVLGPVFVGCSGKTGMPDAQTAGVAFNITVNAVDAVWSRVKSTDTITITSNDGSATLPADAALLGGTATFSVTFGTAGSWTVTAADVTDGTKTPNTGTPTTTN